MGGFSREELAAAASRQQRKKLTVFDKLPVAPSKEEILAAIVTANGSNKVYDAVAKLFTDRGL